MIIHSNAWAILKDLCDDDPMYLELVAKLLDTERQYQTMSRRKGVYKALTACFETSALPKAAAIEQAETIREMKQAQGHPPKPHPNRDEPTDDTDKIDVAAFQNAWAKVKFGQASTPTQ